MYIAFVFFSLFSVYTCHRDWLVYSVYIYMFVCISIDVLVSNIDVLFSYHVFVIWPKCLTSIFVYMLISCNVTFINKCLVFAKYLI